MNVLMMAIALFGHAALQAQQAPIALSDTQQPTALVEKTNVLQISKDSKATPVLSSSNTQLAQMQRQLAQKEIVIEKLTAHLESALKRLNALKSDHQMPSEVSAVLAARDKAQRESVQLKEELSRLKRELAMLKKQKQLLDLENRQLFHALNGVERANKSQLFGKSVYSDASKNSSNDRVANYR